MAIRVESFRTLDNSLARAIGEVWDEIADDYIAEVVRRVEAGEAPERVVHELNLDPALERNRDRIVAISKMALLFGAAQARDIDNARVRRLVAESPLFDNAVRQFEAMIKGAEVHIKNRALKIIQDAEARQTREADAATRRKQIIPQGLTEFANAGIRPAGMTAIQLSSALHTSRLGVYGYTIEAELDGLQFYKIDEVLDSRTCPVCRLMDGKVFPTEVAAKNIRQVLGDESPEFLASVAPWPAQNEANIADLRKASVGDLIDRGVVMPPFHPYCRGVITRTTQSVKLPGVPAHAPRPIAAIESNPGFAEVVIPEIVAAPQTEGVGFRDALDAAILAIAIEGITS